MGRNSQLRRAGHLLRAVGCSSAIVLAAGLVTWGPPSALVTSAAPLPSCTTANLDVWLDTFGSGAAGSTYYHLNLTNTSSQACALEGYPGVTGVTQAGIQLGSAAGRDSEHPAAPLTLESSSVSDGVNELVPRSTATVILQVTDVFNFPSSSCAPTTAAGFRVYPPGQKESTVVPFPFVACGKVGPTYLHVEAAQKYVATQ